MSETLYVRGPNWVGDVVMSTPVLRSLRQTFPDQRILLGLREYLHPLLEGSPFVDELIVAPRAGASLLARWRHARKLRERGIDRGILLTNSFGSALELFLARLPRRRGYVGEGRAILLNERLRPERDRGELVPRPMTRFYADIVAGLGCKLEDESYELSVSSADETAAREFLERRGIRGERRVVGISPGASFGSSKLWLEERFAALAHRLREELEVEVVLLGGPGEVELLQEIAGMIEPPLAGSPEDWLGLGGLKALIRDLDLLVTTDSGPRAIAQAFAVPQVVLMGPTDPRWTDLNGEVATILRHEVPCGPCHQPVCVQNHDCMLSIEPDQVFQAARRALGSN